jgi:prepilin-type N-terminal cleavage/methylation domain-containing protein
MLSDRKGFTLMELLIVVVIIGILAAIAIPKFGQSRERAYVAAMQSDIGQARTAMEMCYQDGAGGVFYSYQGCGLVQVGIAPGRSGFTTGVAMVIDGQTPTDYRITTTHTGTSVWSCSYQHSSGADAGQIVCARST